MKFSLVLICCIFSNSLFSQSPATALKITPLTGDFYVYTTYKSYEGTPFPANGLYLVTTRGIVMIDAPWDTTQFQPLLDSFQVKHHQKPVMYIATHSHDDRSGGLEFYRKYGVKTYTTKQTDAISKARKGKRAEYLLDKDTTFTVGQYTFKTCYAGPGHTSDNIVVWFEKDRILYGGCLVKSMEATNLGFTGDANIQAWPRTIKTIKRNFKHPQYVIPGHQAWDDPRALDHTLKLLRQHGKRK